MAAPFKAYDIRGIYGKDIDEDLAYKVGRAYIKYLNAKEVVVGRDMRTSSPSLSQALIDGILDEGANVIDIGLSSTDMLYFANIHLGSDGAIQVTASHNSKEYNGLKFTRKGALPIGIDSGLRDIENIVKENDFIKKERGKVASLDLLDDFIKFMHSFVDPLKLKPLNVVIDAGNGMAGLILPKLFRNSPLNIHSLFYDLDGSFPNHDANPLEEKNRIDLVDKVIKVGADLGVGLDGDVDRAFFVDGKGKFCSGDFILGLLSKEVLKKNPGSTIVYDVRCSRYVKDVVAGLGGIAKMGKVGHAYAKIFMKEIGAVFGGEVSGHYYFKYKDSYFDSGHLTALVLLKYLSDYDLSLEEAMEDTKGYFISGEINNVVKDPDAVIAKILKLYSDKVKILNIDGISLISDDWWVNIRKSNTEPLLRLNCEAYDKNKMEYIRDRMLELITS